MVQHTHLPRSAAALEKDIQVMENQYTICSDHMAKGVDSKFDASHLGLI